MGLDISLNTDKHEVDLRKRNWLIPWVESTLEVEVENCKDYFITKEQVGELLKRLEDVRDDHSKAPELLPTRVGFFFGDTEYDEWYFADIEDALTRIKEVYDDMSDNEEATFWCWW